MKEGIPVIPGVLLLPSTATASTFTAGSGNALSKSRDPSQISTSPCSHPPSALSSHHIAARSLRAGCPEERGGRVESSSSQTTRHPPPCTLTGLSPALAAGPPAPSAMRSFRRRDAASSWRGRVRQLPTQGERRAPVPPAMPAARQGGLPDGQLVGCQSRAVSRTGARRCQRRPATPAEGPVSAKGLREACLAQRAPCKHRNAAACGESRRGQPCSTSS